MNSFDNILALQSAEKVFTYIQTNRKIEAIKEIRAFTGLTLKDAKDIADICFGDNSNKAYIKHLGILLPAKITVDFDSGARATIVLNTICFHGDKIFTIEELERTIKLAKANITEHQVSMYPIA